MKSTNKRNREIFIIFLTALMAMPTMIFSQDDEEDIEKISPRVKMTYVAGDSDSYSLAVKVTHRVKRKNIPLENVLVNLYLNEITRAGMMGSLNTDENGMAIFPLVNKFKAAKDTLSSYNFTAKIYNDPQVEDGLHELQILPANAVMELVEDEDGKRIQLNLTTIDEEGETVPVPDAELVLFVKRSFSLLSISGDYFSTDDDGFAEVEFPENLPGDENGNLTIIGGVQDHEYFGNLEVTKEAQWGVAKVTTEKPERALWASGKNAPIWLILVSNGIIIAVWFVIVYILLQIRKIYLIGKP